LRGARPILMTHAEHRDLAQTHGVDFCELPGDPRALLATRAGLELLDTRDPVRSLGGLRDLAADLVEEVIEVLEAALADVDVVVFSTLAVAAYHVAEAHGVPAVWGVLQPVTETKQWPSLLVAPGRDLGGPLNLASHRVADRLAWWMLAPGLMAYRRRLGLPRFERGRIRDSLVTLGGWSPQLAPRPADWPAQVHVTGAWRLPVSAEPELPAAVSEFLAGGPMPVYVGMGSATVADPAEVTAMFVAAARDVGVRLVLSSGWAGLGDGDALPSPGNERDVLVVGDVSHGHLFPQCAAVVHHAGAGTTHTALAAGVPTVPTPFWADQSFWAARTARLGVSTNPVPKRTWTRAAVANAIARATAEPWRRDRAARVGQQERRQDGAGAAARAVLDVAADGRGPGGR
jgi:sterol 3beta-glucosyltransferase